MNPMNLINDAINNHPANKRMEEKYGHLANLGPDGYVRGGGGNYPRSNNNNNNNNNKGNKGGKKNNNNKGKDGKSSFLLSC